MSFFRGLNVTFYKHVICARVQIHLYLNRSAYPADLTMCGVPRGLIFFLEMTTLILTCMCRYTSAHIILK